MRATLSRLFTTNVQAPPAPFASERDRLSAEVEYEKGLLPELALLVRLGRRQSEDLERAERHVARLEEHLAKLNAQAAATNDLDTRRREAGPGRMEALRSQLREHARLLEELSRSQGALQRSAAELQNDFQWKAGLNFDVLVLARSLSRQGSLMQIVERWLQRARMLGVFGEPEPERQRYIDPRDLMSEDERLKLQDAKRRRPGTAR